MRKFWLGILFSVLLLSPAVAQPVSGSLRAENKLKELTGQSVASMVLSTSTSTTSGAFTGSVLQSMAAKRGERISIGDFGGSPASETGPWGLAVTAITAAGGGVLYYPTAGPTGWNKSHTTTPAGMGYSMDGPAAHYEPMIGIADDELVNGTAWAGVPPQGATQNQSWMGCAEAPIGQGTSGTTDEDSCFNIRVEKQNFKTTAVPGGMGGMVIAVHGGGPSSVSNDTYAYNTFVECAFNTGFCQQSENVVESLASGNSSVGFESDIQQQVQDDQTGSYIGFNMTPTIGTFQTGMRFTGSGANRWSNIIQNSYGGIQNLWITDTGSYVMSSDGTTATRILLGDVAGVAQFTNFAGTVLFSIGQTGNVGVGGNLAVAGTTAITGNSTFTGTAAFNGGLTGTTGSFSSTLAAGSTSVTGTLGVSGITTFGSWDSHTVSAAVSSGGTNLATATILTSSLNNVTTCASGGVSLPVSAPVGTAVKVFNRCGLTFNIYPDTSGDTIEGSSAGVAVTLASTLTATFTRITTGNWLQN